MASNCRFFNMLLAFLILLIAVPAVAKLCPACQKLSHTKDIGSCKICNGMTESGQFQVCMQCSDRLRECERCRMALPASNTEGTTPDSTMRLVVMVQIMTTDRGSPIKEEWILNELKTMNAPATVGVSKDWFPLDGKVRIHDSKHFGQAYLTLHDPGGDKPLSVEISGSQPTTVNLLRKPGTKLVVFHGIGSSIASKDFYLGFRVEAPVK